jgi:hypothetical protein
MTDSLPTAEVAELAKEETRRLRLGAVRKMLSEMNEHQLREFVFQLYATGMACLPDGEAVTKRIEWNPNEYGYANTAMTGMAWRRSSTPATRPG